jgi:SpoVK/Ycf46/Vps4 family AAA+-type ATPase
MGIGSRVAPNSRPVSGNAVQPLFSMGDLIVPVGVYDCIQDFFAFATYERVIFDEWGLSSTHKNHKQTVLNFYGPPGTGKTMAAHAVASELNRNLLIVNYAELESKYVGETSKNLEEVFSEAKLINSVIFFDEADAILSRRVTNMSHSTDVSVNQTRSVLLMLMNQYEGLVIFATNFIENYDPAFMRRLSHIYFPLPDVECRKRLWMKYIPTKMPHSDNATSLAERSDGFSGSDISNCVLKAALSAARLGLGLITHENFQSAIEEIRRSKKANERNNFSSTNVVSRVVSEDDAVKYIERF